MGSVLYNLCGADFTFWVGNDFSPCARQLFIDGLIPLLYFLLSALTIFSFLRSRRSHGYAKLPTTDINLDSIYDEDDLDADPAEIALKNESSVSTWFIVQESIRILLALLQITAISALISERHMHDEKDRQNTPIRIYSEYVSAIIWLYMLILSLLKVSNYRLNVHVQAKLNHHQHMFYLCSAVIAVVDLRSLLILDDSKHSVADIYRMSVNVFASSILAFIAVITHIPGVLSEKDGRITSYECKSSIWERVSFGWLDLLMRLGYKRPLDDPDLWELPPELRVRRALYDLNRQRCDSLLATIFYVHRYPLFLQAVFSLAGTGLLFAPPHYLNRVLTKLQADEMDDETRVSLYFDLFFMVSGGLMAAASKQRSLWIGRETGSCLRATLSAEVYEKSLRRRDTAGYIQAKPTDGSAPDEDETADVGKVTNLLNVDSSNVADLMSYLDYLYANPIQVVIALIMLWNLLGYSVIFGVGCMIFTNVAMTLLANWYRKIVKVVSEAGDARLNLVTELLNGIRIVKLFAWEENFKEKITKSRDHEQDMQLSRLLRSILLWSTNFLGTSLVLLLTLSAYTLLLNKPLNPAIAFTAFALFNVLRSALSRIPMYIQWAMRSLVSVRRIEAFLKEEELEKSKEDSEDAIGFIDAAFRWPNNDAFTLSGLDFFLPMYKLSVIAGPTGSGKTSFLMALLGELHAVRGRSIVPRREGRIHDVAFVAQKAWLQNATIRDNILFGNPYNEERYRKVVFGCALIPDFEVLEGGDLTEIGEKGVTLSGGQKQRISLARALYSPAKHLFLDDCLSAVDSHTARHLYENALTGDLCKDRTRILVTHQIGLCLRDASYAVVIRDGRVAAHGTAHEIHSQGAISDILEVDIDPLQKVEKKKVEMDMSQAVVSKLVQKETRAQGSVSLSVYWDYMKACGGIPFWGLLMGGQFAMQSVQVMQSNWVRIWADQYAKDTPVDAKYYISVYFGISLFALVADAFKDYVMFLGSLAAGRKLHVQLLDRILYATPRFFDSTPVGRILNRFSRDIQVIDQDIASSLNWLLYLIFEALSVIVVITAITPQFLFIAFGISLVYIWFTIYYLASSREIKRIESTTKSPLLSLFGESVTGVVTIRAYGAEDRFIRENYRRIDDFNRPFYLLWGCNRWLSWRIDCSGALVSFCSGLLVIFNRHNLNAGLAGLSLTYALNFNDSMLWIVRATGMAEIAMNSVERVFEYLDIEQEASPVVENHRPPRNWPHHGNVKIQNLEIRYVVEKDPVLRNLNFEIKGGERVGVVGRTGSGKSTLALALFRFIEAYEGHIIIDNIDIASIGLRDLRSKLTIIPQDAVLFAGTVRTNLDPFNEHDDETLWRSLRRSRMVSLGEGDNRQTLIKSLEDPVSANGENFSQGQRQLLALARALLRNSKVIILDEATASVDFDTDSKVQETIRTEFIGNTLICIAHRLRTVIDYDKVLVLDQGKLMEFDTPLNLLLQPNSIFRSMCEKTGELDLLLEIAQNKQQQE